MFRLVSQLVENMKLEIRFAVLIREGQARGKNDVIRGQGRQFLVRDACLPATLSFSRIAHIQHQVIPRHSSRCAAQFNS